MSHSADNASQRLCYEGVHCTVTLEHCTPRVVLVTISGSDVGEFGTAPTDALQQWLRTIDEVELYIDAREVRGATVEVSSEWSKWFIREKAKLRAITMLTGSHFVRVTAEFVRRFAELDGIMRICTEPAVFEAALGNAREHG